MKLAELLPIRWESIRIFHAIKLFSQEPFFELAPAFLQIVHLFLLFIFHSHMQMDSRALET